MPRTDDEGPRKRRPRGSINAQEILAGAFEVARGSSLDQLSMPNLAEHLGLSVTSIYWYFRKKEDLLDAMTDLAADTYLRLLPEVRAEETWQHTLAAHFRAQREIHGEDEILSDLLFIRPSRYSPETARRSMEAVEAVVAKLVADGFTPDNALLAYNAAGVYARGSIMQDRVLRLAHAPTTDTARQRRMMDWSGTPVLDGLVDRHPLAGTGEEDFEFGLARLISGFEVLLSEQGSAGASEASARTARRPKAPAARRSAPRKAAS